MNRGLTVRQVCMVTGAEPSTVRSWISRGFLARNRWGRIDMTELLTFLDARDTRSMHTKLKRKFGL